MSDAPGSGFGKFVPGFEFLQNLAGQAAGGVAQGISQNIPQLPNLGSWVAPTFNVEDLEKRIEELKAVHFWLDQNAKALGATIQALEVQKMTLSTLKTMNFSMGDVPTRSRSRPPTPWPASPVHPPPRPRRSPAWKCRRAPTAPLPSPKPRLRRRRARRSRPARRRPPPRRPPVAWWTRCSGGARCRSSSSRSRATR
ncbi:PhaM family polyhydroxyalkanoate granule multifunctional regulatory protein [Hydrogenophaga sp. UC242_53]|uniref:PhaM family polyhydroxyalkanoate granule multifunctional regulatory protein n=1 Tax=Hydrogenophaga sp. UC242_53 TaxID=3350170 RepID=UPI0036D3E971